MVQLQPGPVQSSGGGFATPAPSVYQDPSGGTPITGDVPTQWGQGQWQGTGGGTTAQEFYAMQDFNKLFGRNPTQSELDMISPSYASGDPNVANNAQGKQYLNQYYQSLANTPANIYSRQQQQWQSQAPQNYGQVGQMVQSTLGRAATQDELSHYGTLIASGQADPYQIQQFLMSTPEYQNSQDTQFRKGVDTTLQQSDENFFNRAKGDITQQYALMGRATSPALDVALTDMASKLNDSRQTYLAQLSASQYGGNKATALQNYGATQNQVQGQINQNTQGIYGNYQALLNRGQNITDYNTQNQNYMRAMGQYGNKGPTGLDYLNTAFNGVSAGARAYGAGGG